MSAPGIRLHTLLKTGSMDGTGFSPHPVMQTVCIRAPLLPRCAENVYGSSCATLRTYDRTAILLQREGFDPPSILSLLALFC